MSELWITVFMWMLWTLIGLIALFVAFTLLVAAVYLISKAATRGKIDAWMYRLRQAQRRKR